jgi:hypothetical protein
MSDGGPDVAESSGGRVPVNCPGCGRSIQLLPDQLSLKLQCSHCNTVFVLDEPHQRLPDSRQLPEPFDIVTVAENKGQRRKVGMGLLLSVLFFSICGAIVFGVIIVAAPKNRFFREAKADLSVADLLTKDERIAWEKSRKQHPTTAYWLFGFFPGEEGWLVFHDSWMDVNIRDLDRNIVTSWKRSIGVGYGELRSEGGLFLSEDELDKANEQARSNGLANAENAAKGAVTNPKVKIVAIVDLYSQHDPVVVEWVYDDSKAVRILKRPPQPELGRELDEFLLWLQRQRGK